MKFIWALMLLAFMYLPEYFTIMLHFYHLNIWLEFWCFSLPWTLSGFSQYMISSEEPAYQQLCSEITLEFSDCSKQVCHLIMALISIYSCNTCVFNKAVIRGIFFGTGPWDGVFIFISWLLPSQSSSSAQSCPNARKTEIASGKFLNSLKYSYMNWQIS